MERKSEIKERPPIEYLPSGHRLENHYGRTIAAAPKYAQRPLLERWVAGAKYPGIVTVWVDNHMVDVAQSLDDLTALLDELSEVSVERICIRRHQLNGQDGGILRWTLPQMLFALFGCIMLVDELRRTPDLLWIALTPLLPLTLTVGVVLALKLFGCRNARVGLELWNIRTVRGLKALGCLIVSMVEVCVRWILIAAAALVGVAVLVALCIYAFHNPLVLLIVLFIFMPPFIIVIR